MHLMSYYRYFECAYCESVQASTDNGVSCDNCGTSCDPETEVEEYDFIDTDAARVAAEERFGMLQWQQRKRQSEDRLYYARG